MNPSLRPGPQPKTRGGRQLATALPGLVTRIHAARIDQLAQRLEEDSRAAVPESADHGFAITMSVEGRALLARYATIRTRRRELTTASEAVRTDAERRAVLLHHLRTTVTDARQLKEDIAALDRWLDIDALLERLDKDARDVFVDLELLARALSAHPLRGEPSLLLDALVESPHAPTRRAACATLAPWVAHVLRTGKDRDGTLIDSSSERIDRLLALAMERGGDPLMARRALRVIAGMSEQNASRLLLQRLELPGKHETGVRDDFLVRAAAIQLAVEVGPNTARNAFMVARQDPSETVRCALADALAESATPNARQLLQRLLAEDTAESVQVRARRALAPERKPEPDDELEQLADELAALPLGGSGTRRLPADHTADQLATALLRRAQRDVGFGIEPLSGDRVRVQRGQDRVFRLWRFFHALRTGDPGKRQGGDHLSGRTLPGRLQVPPPRMAEVSPTEVPARPVMVESYGSWCPWLPLPDQLVDSLWRGRIRLVSDAGWTQITPPPGVRRLWAAWALSWKVERYADLRSESLHAEDAAGQSQYAEALAELGFDIQFQPHHAEIDERVPRLFGAPLELPDNAPMSSIVAVALLDELNRFLALHPVEPTDLALVGLVIGVIFFSRLAWNKLRTKRARASIPLVVGGWGTRGKSGVARLKAALFEGLGYDVVCKTTGCEAMLMRTPSLRGAIEVYLFRPFDKATIWEHAEVLGQSAELGAEVFVWECMALRPEYVEQLQLLWTRDDVSTITNTYPDHEDVMGPTGDDVADVIARFMPEQALTITTETQMTAVLRERARELDTTLLEIDEDGIAAIPEDLRARFPYQEHPANLALVAQLAQELELDLIDAMVLMADHVVPDLGVLATFTPLRHRGRTLEFSNGSSANERTGFLNNWRRCGFDADPQPDTFLVAVINNRYDRVARSQVFAEILVNDARAHRYVCIGTNLEGLRGYISDALEHRLSRIDVFGGGPGAVAGRLDSLGRDLRVVDVPALLRATFPKMALSGPGVEELLVDLDRVMADVPATPLDLDAARLLLGDIGGRLVSLATEAGTIFHPNAHPDAPFHDARDRDYGLAGAGDLWVELAVEALAFEATRRACLEAVQYDAGGGEDFGTLEVALVNLFRSIFLRHVVIVAEEGASGDTINERIALSVPLGADTRVMSCQNIKGTGLDLVYRWVYTRKPMRWVEDLSDRDPEVVRRALVSLREWKEWSLCLVHEVSRGLQRMPEDVLPQLSSEVLRKLNAELKLRGKAMSDVTPLQGEQGLLRGLLNEVVDPFLGIFRRLEADRVIEDLGAGRISHARARDELHRLTLIQRGEWIDD